jgi:CBS domain-containing protein
MKTVGNLLNLNALPVCVTPEATVRQAMTMMGQNSLGAILVMDGRNFIGLFTERDFSRLADRGESLDDIEIKEVMSLEAVSAPHDMGVQAALSMMNQLGALHMPVLADGEIVGFVTILQVVDAVLKERDSIIADLAHYVSATWPI